MREEGTMGGVDNDDDEDMVGGMMGDKKGDVWCEKFRGCCVEVWAVGYG